MTAALIGNSIYLGISAFEAGTVYFQSKSPKFFETMHKVKAYVHTLNISAILYTTYQLYYDAGLSNYLWSWVPLDHKSAHLDVIYSIALLGAMLAVYLLYLAVMKANDYFASRNNAELKNWPANDEVEITPEIRGRVTVKQEASSYQCRKQVIQVVQIISSIAMACLSANPYFFAAFAASAALQLYSLAKTTQWKWIKFERIFDSAEVVRDRFVAEGPRSYRISYYTSMLPANKPDECSICLEVGAKTQFCANHIFHENCILGVIYTKSAEFHAGMKPFRTIVRKYSNGVYVGDDVRYRIDYPKNNLPSCPNCRGRPEYNELHINVEDGHNGKTEYVDASITLTE